MLKLNLAASEKTLWFMRLPSIDDLLLKTFERLPVDKYLGSQSQFRYRRYNTGKVDNKHFSWDSDSNYFTQSLKINHVAGEIKRFYEPLEEPAKDYVKNTLIPLAQSILPAKQFSTGAHQIRVCTHDNLVGKPSPEGIHQDGFEYVIVACINLQNIAGGNSIFVDSNDRNNIIHEQIMKPYDVILFDDTIYAHYVSPIVPKIPGNGYRDVIIVTFKEQK